MFLLSHPSGGTAQRPEALWLVSVLPSAGALAGRNLLLGHEPDLRLHLKTDFFGLIILNLPEHTKLPVTVLRPPWGASWEKPGWVLFPLAQAIVMFLLSSV